MWNIRWYCVYVVTDVSYNALQDHVSDTYCLCPVILVYC